MIVKRERPLPIVKYSRTRDSFRRYVTDVPTPEAFASWLRAVDYGDYAALCEMQQELEAKSAVIQGIVGTRRNAVTALDWDIEPEESTTQHSHAIIAASYCRKRLREIETWPDTLKHFSDAIGPNVAAVELVWHKAQLVKTVDVPSHRLTRNHMIDKPTVAIETDDFPEGLPVDFAPHKFVLFHPHPQAGFPFRKTLTHATVWPYLVGHFSRTDWMAFSELYGNPIRTATFEDGVIDADRDTVLDMLEQMGSDTGAAIPKGIAVALLQAAGRGETFEAQLAWAEKTLAILWLGQTLTTDVGDRGSFAAAEVHDNIRADILLADIEAEARMIRDQILRPMVRLRFPTVDMPTPYFVRQTKVTRDIESERLSMDQVNAAKALGLEMDVDEVYDKLSLTRPRGVEQTTIGGSADASQGQQ